MSAKRIIFDAIWFTYSIAALAYCLTMVDQDWSLAHFPELTISTLLLLVIMGLVSFFLTKTNCVTLGSELFEPKKRPGKVWKIHLLVTFLLTLWIGLRLTEFSFMELTDPNGLAGAWRLYQGLTHANLHLLPLATLQVIETIFIAFLATAIAVPMAFVISFISARNIMTHPVAFVIYAMTRTLQNLIRSVEPLILALVFTVWVGVGPFAGMLALMVHTLASLAKQFSEIIEDINAGPVEAIRSTGANEIQVVWFGVVPQVLMPFISFTIYRWDTNLRMATIIGFVGGGGIGTMLLKYQGQAMWSEVGCIIFVIAIAVWLMDLASAYLREALR